MTLGLISIGRPVVLSKRSIINMNFARVAEYHFIDHIRNGTQFGGAGQIQWKTGAIWTQQIDSDGWPNYSTAVTAKAAGVCGINIPASADFFGPYTIDGFGSGSVSFSVGTWTLGVATGATLSGNTLTVTDQGAGVRWTAQLTYSGARQTIGINIPSCDPANTGKFVKKIRFYRTADTADLVAGKIFRAPWKQLLVDLNPSAIRFMNWTGANDNHNGRFEFRSLPSHATWSDDPYNWVAGPRYGETTGTNSISLAAVTGTPASMQHGEMALCRILNSTVRNGAFNLGLSTDRVVTNITNANPGVVSAVAHGFNTGDVVVHVISGGMTKLNRFPVTVTVVDADHYSIGVDTTSYGAFIQATTTGTTTGTSTSITGLGPMTGLVVGQSISGTNVPPGSVITVLHPGTSSLDLNHNTTGTSTGTYVFGCAATTNQWISLTVGTGNDRVPADGFGYPVVFPNIGPYASHYGDGYIVAGDYKGFYFDKTITAKTDGNGNNIYGVWIFNQNGTFGHTGGVPLEVCTSLINELMAMSRTDGGTVGPINMYVTIPHRALLSDDPDYSAASNFATKSVDVILNGANGFLGLDARCELFVEYSNETWNAGANQTGYLSSRGLCRWPSGGASDSTSMPSLRSYLMCKDIQTAFPNTGRIRYVLAGQGAQGIVGGANPNALRIAGSTLVLTDPFASDAVPARSLNPSGASPMSLHDYFAWGAYIYNDDSNSATSLTTATAAWIAAGSNPVAQEAAYTLYVAGIHDHSSDANNNQTIDNYYNVLLPLFASALTAIGKQTIMYEGGWDHAISGTTDQINFLIACKQSQTWGNALRAAHDSFNTVNGAYMPADYIEMDSRWGHAFPDLYKGGVEGANLDFAWQGMASRNRGIN